MQKVNKMSITDYLRKRGNLQLVVYGARACAWYGIQMHLFYRYHILNIENASRFKLQEFLVNQEIYRHFDME